MFLKFPLKRGTKQDQLAIVDHWVTDGKIAISKGFLKNFPEVEARGDLKSGHSYIITPEQKVAMAQILETHVSNATLGARIIPAMHFSIGESLEAVPIVLSNNSLVYVSRAYLELFEDMQYTTWGSDPESTIVLKCSVPIAVIMPLRVQRNDLAARIWDFNRLCQLEIKRDHAAEKTAVTI